MPVMPSKSAVSHGVYSLTPTSTVSEPSVMRARLCASSSATVNGAFIGWPSLPAGPVSFDSTRPLRTVIWYCWPPMCAPFGRGLVE
jgi:hypothetical protein